jgi:hypothetical protein
MYVTLGINQIYNTTLALRLILLMILTFYSVYVSRLMYIQILFDPPFSNQTSVLACSQTSPSVYQVYGPIPPSDWPRQVGPVTSPLPR